MKPDPEIYEYLCDEYWLEPEESVFIDDRPVNIEGAKNVVSMELFFVPMSRPKRNWRSFLRNSNISAKIFSKNQECDKMTYGNCFWEKLQVERI